MPDCFQRNTTNSVQTNDATGCLHIPQCFCPSVLVTGGQKVARAFAQQQGNNRGGNRGLCGWLQVANVWNRYFGKIYSRYICNQGVIPVCPLEIICLTDSGPSFFKWSERSLRRGHFLFFVSCVLRCWPAVMSFNCSQLHRKGSKTRIPPSRHRHSSITILLQLLPLSPEWDGPILKSPPPLPLTPPSLLFLLLRAFDRCMGRQ